MLSSLKPGTRYFLRICGELSAPQASGYSCFDSNADQDPPYEYDSVVTAPGTTGYQTDAGIAYGRCPEKEVGTEGQDTVTLSIGADGFDGLGGQDQINGGDGDDCLFGNFGNDGVSGGAGNDVVAGGAGADSLQGDAGDDDIDAMEYATDASAGIDTIGAGSGNDDIKADDGFQDTIDCGPGQDRVDADQLDTVLATCEQRVDLIGADVYHANHWTGDPAAGGELLAEEWAVVPSKVARREIADMINTRTNVPCQDGVPAGPWCAEVRWRTLESQFEGAGPDDLDTFAEHRGASQEDPNVPQIASLLDPVAAIAAGRTPVSTGPLGDALASWQVAPPGHGHTYEVYEVTNQFRYNSGTPDPTTGEYGDGVEVGTSTMRVWVDAATKLPIRETLTADNESVSSYWSYDPSVRRISDFPSDFFRVARPGEAALSQSVDYGGQQVPAEVRDDETAMTFTPYTLGDREMVANRTNCLSTNLVFRQSERPVDDFPGSPGPDLSSLTRVDALYAPAPPKGSCRSGSVPTENTALTVSSVARRSGLAEAYRNALLPRAEALAAPIRSAPGTTAQAPFRAGRVYVAPGTAGGHVALAEIGGTTIVVNGKFSTDEAVDLLANLEGR